MAAVRGFEECLSALSKLEDRVAKKKILAGAVRKAMVPLEGEIKRTAPDDPETPGNRIVKYTRRAALNQSSVGVLGKTGVTPAGFPGYFIEFGTDDIDASPFAEPAEERTRAEFMSILGDELWVGVIGQAVGEALDG